MSQTVIGSAIKHAAHFFAVRDRPLGFVLKMWQGKGRRYLNFIGLTPWGTHKERGTHMEETGQAKYDILSRLVPKINSPLRFFGLISLICDSIFAICASYLKEPQLFIYCIHMFIAIISMLTITALWCPRSLYHPSDLNDVGNDALPKSKPWIPTLFAMVCLIIYLVYQLYLVKMGTSYITPDHRYIPNPVPTTAPTIDQAASS